MKYRLYHYWRSSSSWRVRWAMAIKGIPCEFTAINLLTDEAESPEHLARNPLGYIPVLELEEGNKGSVKYLAESMAIIEFLEENHPKPSLLPGDSYHRAKMRQLAEVINADTQPLQNPNVAAFHSSNPDEQKKWNQHWIGKGLHAYEVLVNQTAGKFSVGDEITLPDLYLIPQCYNAKRFEVDLEAYPCIFEIFNHALTTPSCQASSPDRLKPREAS